MSDFEAVAISVTLLALVVSSVGAVAYFLWTGRSRKDKPR